MRIGQLARLTGKSVAALRYYEQAGLLPPPARTAAGYREYPPEAVERVAFIIRAQGRGFALDEIGAILALHDSGHAPCESVATAAREKVLALEREIAGLQDRRAALLDVLGLWEGGLMRDAPICPMLGETQSDNRRREGMARKVEVFTAGCALCDPVVELVKRIACPSCDVTVHNLKDDPKAAERAKAAGVQRVPMVLVDGKPAECCQAGAVTEAGLRAAGIGAA